MLKRNINTTLLIFIMLFISACGGKTVTDPDTNLMWQDNAAAKKVKKTWLSKEMNDKEEFHNTAGDTAISYCDNLSLEGYEDWRLPTEDELGSLIDENRSEPSSKEFIKNVEPDFYWTSTTSGEDNLISIQVNDTQLGGETSITKNGKPVTEAENMFAYIARIIYFSHGKRGASEKYNLGHVRCVRN